MVLEVNQKIKLFVDVINVYFVVFRVLFVDYDVVFEGYCFCEFNIIEFDYVWNEMWFFLVGGQDSGQNSGNYFLFEEFFVDYVVIFELLFVDLDCCFGLVQ